MVIPDSWGGPREQRRLREFNTSHVPAGSSKGGQFASKDSEPPEESNHSDSEPPESNHISDPEQSQSSAHEDGFGRITIDHPPGTSALPDTPLQTAMRTLGVAEKQATGSESSSQSYWMTLTDGSRVFYKPVDGEGWKYGGTWLRSGITNTSFAQSERELLAHDVARVIGVSDIVPEMTLRQEGAGWGSAQQAASGNTWGSGGGFSDFKAAGGDVNDLWRMATLDMLTGNTDRHPGQVMFDSKGKFWALDNSLTFPSVNERFRLDLSNQGIWENPSNAASAATVAALYEGVKKLNVDTLTKGFAMTPAEKAAFRSRVESTKLALSAGPYRLAQGLYDHMKWYDGDLNEQWAAVVKSAR